MPMDLGSLIATLGVDSAPLRTAEGDLRTFGSTASSTFSQAGAAASSCASQFLAIAGVTLSVVGAIAVAQKAVSSWYSTIMGGINAVEEFQKTVISTAYTLTTMSDVKKPDLTKAYGEWTEYFDWLWRASLEADKKSAAGAKEIFTIGVELRKKGVKIVNDEDMATVGRLTDLMKAVTPVYASLEMQARGEIEAMMSGITRMGAQTSIILSQIDPKFKENIENARKAGTVLEYIRTLLPEIQKYTLEMMGTLDAVTSSMKSAWSVVQIRAFGDAHKDIVKFVGDLATKLVTEGKLTQEGELLAAALGTAWSKAKTGISGTIDYLLDNLPLVIDKISFAVTTVGTFVGGMASAALSVMQWVNNNIELLKSLAEFAIIAKITNWIIGLAAEIVTLTIAHVSQATAATASSVATAGLTATTIACTEATLAATLASNGLATSNAIVLTNASGAVVGVRALTTAVATGAAGAQVATVAYSALAAVIGGLVIKLAAVAAIGGVYGAYKTIKEPGQAWSEEESAIMAAAPGVEYVGGRTPKQYKEELVAEIPGPPAPPDYVLEMNKKLDEVQATTSKNAPPTPETRPFTGKEKKEKGGGKGVEGAENQLKSFIDTMISETARGAGETDAILNAWYDKQILALEKIEAKGIDATKGYEALYSAYLSKKEKLDRDFNDWYISGLGNQTSALKIAEEKKLREVAGNETKIAQVREVFMRKQALLENEQNTQRLSLAKSYLDQFASLIPGLEDQLRYKRMILDIERQQADLNLNRLLLEGKITEEVYNQSRAAQAFVNQLKDYQLRLQEMSKGGVWEGLQLWGTERNKESATATTSMVKTTMKDLETGLSGAMSTSLINAMKGTQTSWEDFFMSVAETGIKKGFDYITSELFTGLAKLFGNAALSLVDPLVYGSSQGATALEVGGQNAGISIYNWCVAGANVLASAGGGGGPGAGSFGGFLSGIFGGSRSTAPLGGNIGSGEVGTGGDIWGDIVGMIATPMAKGGIVTQPTLAMVAEAGEPEAVIPLSSFGDKSFLDMVSSQESDVATPPTPPAVESPKTTMASAPTDMVFPETIMPSVSDLASPPSPMASPPSSDLVYPQVNTAYPKVTEASAPTSDLKSSKATMGSPPASDIIYPKTIMTSPKTTMSSNEENPTVIRPIPMATGGVVTRPTLAMLAEGGEPEVVMPLSSFGDMSKKDRETVVEINISMQNNTGTPIKATGQRTSDKEFMIMLDTMNESLVRGDGKFARALDQRYKIGQATVKR